MKNKYTTVAICFTKQEKIKFDKAYAKFKKVKGVEISMSQYARLLLKNIDNIRPAYRKLEEGSENIIRVAITQNDMAKINDAYKAYKLDNGVTSKSEFLRLYLNNMLS